MAEKNDKLSGIERQLVLQYLMDGNVPVTLTPVILEEKKSEKIHSISSQIFPVALRAENIKVTESGKIYLENPPQSVIGFENKEVKVEFYFNRVGLFFIETIKKDNNTLYFELPNEISRISDEEDTKEYDFSAVLYFEYKNKKDLNIKCIPWNKIDLFTRPAWKSIPLENQHNAKKLLEIFVEQAKEEKNAGNGIQLIPICNFLTSSNNDKMESLQNRVKPINVLYVDHERIVLGFDDLPEDFFKGSEFGLKMSFLLKESPILSRDVYVTFFVNKIYKADNSELQACIDCVYTSIQEEDIRYLYEKATKTHFI